MNEIKNSYFYKIEKAYESKYLKIQELKKNRETVAFNSGLKHGLYCAIRAFEINNIGFQEIAKEIGLEDEIPLR